MDTIPIVIYSVSIAGQRVYDQQCEYITHISCEWADLEDVIRHYIKCTKPICNCVKGRESYLTLMHLWGFQTDCNGRQGTDVAARLTAALKTLNRYKIMPATEDIFMHEQLKATYRGRLQVFAYELNRLLTLAQRYSHCYFVNPNDKLPLLRPNGIRIERFQPIIPDHELELTNKFDAVIMLILTLIAIPWVISLL